MADSKVKFVRIHGKLVPLHMRDKSNRTKKAQPAPKQRPAAKAAPTKKGISKTTKAFVVAGIAAVVAYGLLRRYKASKIPQLAKLQEHVKGTGIVMATGVEDPGVQKIQKAMFGTHISNAGGGVVLQHVNGALNGASAQHIINPDELHHVFGDKRTFARMFSPHGAVPQTMNLEDALKRVKGDASKLQDLFPNKKFIIKDDSGALTKFSDFLNQDTIVGNSEKARQFLKHPKRAVIQETMELSNEYRAHYLNGKVYGISHRYLPDGKLKKAWNKVSSALGAGEGGGAFVPVINPRKRAEITKLLTEQMNKIGGEGLGEKASFHAAFDIGDTKQGLKLIEANPSMGTFNNPLINRHFNRLATGRWSRDVAAAGGLGAGVSAGVGARMVMGPDKKLRKRKYG